MTGSEKAQREAARTRERVRLQAARARDKQKRESARTRDRLKREAARVREKQLRARAVQAQVKKLAAKKKLVLKRAKNVKTTGKVWKKIAEATVPPDPKELRCPKCDGQTKQIFECPQCGINGCVEACNTAGVGAICIECEEDEADADDAARDAECAAGEADQKAAEEAKEEEQPDPDP